MTPTVSITRTEVEAFVRKGNIHKTVPAWRLEIDGIFIQNHRTKAVLGRIADDLTTREDLAKVLDWYRAIPS